ncbi:MAG: Yip1 family protein [Caulobacteraceae bacterium]
MTIVEGPARAGLVARVRGILLHPRSEWEAIDAEPATARGLFTGYACILAAIPAVAGFIGRQAFGVAARGAYYRAGPLAGLIEAVLLYILSLVSVFILALIIEALAPTFGGRRDRVSALKVSVYASTAGWVAGVFSLFPPISILTVVGEIYGLYLLYLGLPRLMKAPPDRALAYTVVTILAAIVLGLVVGLVLAALVAATVMGNAGLARTI